MCRLYGFRANEPTKVECSLVLAQNALLAQSRADLRGKDHADGWGIATYSGVVPRVVKRETAAFDTPHFAVTAERLYSMTVLAHVRRATVSGPSTLNTHPFRYGPWTFAHNGTVRGFDRVEHLLGSQITDRFLSIRRGSTDSELAFCWLLENMSRAGFSPEDPCPDSSALARVVQSSVRQLAELSESATGERSELNFLLTDGHTMLATRWRNSLYWLQRYGVHDCEVCGIPHVHHDVATQYQAVVIASEPTTHERWEEVEDRAIVVIHPDLRSEVLAS